MSAPQPLPAPTGEVPGGLPDRVVFFDGVCVVCNRSVDWLLRRDREARLHFAPLQGETAGKLRAALPGLLPEGVESLVYLERTGEGPRLWLRSRALRRILEDLGGAPGLGLLRMIPVPVADLGYRIFAALRYRLFGRRDSCRVPSPAERGRFLP